jgi:hypothetical protein
MKLTGENRRTRGKTCPSVTFSITNPTWTDPGLNPGPRGGRPAANRLSHGTAIGGFHSFEQSSGSEQHNAYIFRVYFWQVIWFYKIKGSNMNLKT